VTPIAMEKPAATATPRCQTVSNEDETDKRVIDRMAPALPAQITLRRQHGEPAPGMVAVVQ